MAVVGFVLLAALAVAIIIVVQRQGGRIVAQIDEFRMVLTEHQAAVGQVLQDITEALDRVETKVRLLGEVDPDLSQDIAAIRRSTEELRGGSNRLDALLTSAPGGVQPGTDPGTPPVSPPEPPEPGPTPPIVEPSAPEQPVVTTPTPVPPEPTSGELASEAPPRGRAGQMPPGRSAPIPPGPSSSR